MLTNRHKSSPATRDTKRSRWVISMSKDLTALPTAMETISATAAGAGQMISAAGTYDAMAMQASVLGAVGPIGAVFLGAFAPAQANNQAATLMLGALHAAIGGATEVSKSGYVNVDSAL